MPKGSDWLSAAEVAIWLEVTDRTVRAWTRRGLLHATYNGRRPRFSRERVEAFAALRRPAGFDIAEVCRRSEEALVLARRAHERIDELQSLLGLERRELARAADDVLAFVRDAERATCRNDEDAREWALRLSSIDEAYLARVHEVSKLEDPWRPFVDATCSLLEAARCSLSAYSIALLESASERLRSVTYGYVRRVHGVRRAGEQLKAGSLPLTLLLARVLADAR